MLSATPPSAAAPRIGLALGAGAARGLAHIAVLEAFDEVGIRPAAIVGTSIGAVLGAAYAAGSSGRELRGHALAIARKRSRTMAALLEARVGRFSDLLARKLTNPVLLDAEMLLDLFWPGVIPKRFEELQIPFTAIATDYFARKETAFASGALGPAVAASMAIPGLIKPVEFEGRILIDGGAVNPLPFDHLLDRCDMLVACDVAGGAVSDIGPIPAPLAALLGAAQIMQAAITAAKLTARRPHLLVRPEVGGFGFLDFFRPGPILRAAEPAKAELKEALRRMLAER